jgi:protein-disulfide isomerase
MDDIHQTPINENVDTTQRKKDRAALGWFGLGALMGGLIVAGAMTILNAQRPTVDMNAIRQAAREGAAEAVALLPTAQTANSETVNPAATDAVPAGAVKVVGRLANSLGAEDAPITIIEYSDFNCGFCKKFHSETFQRVVDDYVKAGKVKVSYKHYPFLAPSSMWMAEAAECAAEQGKFWEYHEALFDGKVNGQGDETLVKQALSTLAIELQLDANKFNACLSAGKVTAQVQADASEGEQMGVRGTPSFLINGKPLVGAQPYEAFKQAIDAALAAR